MLQLLRRFTFALGNTFEARFLFTGFLFQFRHCSRVLDFWWVPRPLGDQLFKAVQTSFGYFWSVLLTARHLIGRGI